MTPVPLVTVVIPAFNEAEDIAGCIDALGAQDYPVSSIELLVVDGDSGDATIERALDAGRRYGFQSVRALRNEARERPHGLNVGLAAASGAFLLRIDARSRVESHYVRTCVEVLRGQPNVGEVGGAQIAQARSGSVVAVGLARAQRNRITSGFSRYRRSRTSGEAEHVWMGAFRTDELRALGGWNEEFLMNEDFELSQRYIRAGKAVWFDARLQSGYLPRVSLRGLATQHFAFGQSKGTYWATGRRPLPRQVLLLCLPPAAVVGGSLLWHRFGAVPALIAIGASALAVEAVGCPGPSGGLRERAIALCGIATYGSSWWVGSVTGFVREKVGIDHRHG